MTAGCEPPAQPRRKLHGRRRGHGLRRRRRDLLESRLPELGITAESVIAEPRRLFPTPVEAVWLEIGFGGGEHLLHRARQNPGIGFLGCEPFMAGVAKLIAGIEEAGLRNLRIFPDDARLLLDALPDSSVGRCFVLFPDPWPKTRHHKRRIIDGGTVDELARVLAPAGSLHLATDDSGYARWMLRRLVGHPSFEWTARGPADWRERPSDTPVTRYEAKALAAGRRPVHLDFRRR